MSRSREDSGFVRAVLICLVLNLIAGAVMPWVLRPGLDPDLPFNQRLLYLAGHPHAWAVAWLLWVAAALGLIYFFIHWGEFLRATTVPGIDVSVGRRATIRFGVLVGCLGMIPDTMAEMIYIGVLPQLARSVTSGPMWTKHVGIDGFILWERAAMLFTGFLGNGFYSLGGLVLNLAALSCPAFPRRVALAGLPLWFVGFGLSAAALAGHRGLLIATTALTIGGFVLWMTVLWWALRVGGAAVSHGTATHHAAGSDEGTD